MKFSRKQKWQKRKLRTRGNIFGTTEKPRLSIYKTNTHLYAQIIDDVAQTTLVSCSTLDKELKGAAKLTKEGAAQIGAVLGKRAKEKGIETVQFDRNGFRYHGQLKALADAAREAGLKF